MSVIRLFIGLSLPPELCDRLQSMQGGVDDVRWTRKENFHITLSFIGDVDDGLMLDVDAALSSVNFSSFPVSLKGVGYFAHGDDEQHLWLGVEENAALRELQKKIANALEVKGIPHIVRREYTPHVTLGRLENASQAQLDAFMQTYNEFEEEAFDVSSFALYQSGQGKKGGVYSISREYEAVIDIT